MSTDSPCLSLLGDYAHINGCSRYKACLHRSSAMYEAKCGTLSAFFSLPRFSFSVLKANLVKHIVFQARERVLHFHLPLLNIFPYLCGFTLAFYPEVTVPTAKRIPAVARWQGHCRLPCGWCLVVWVINQTCYLRSATENHSDFSSLPSPSSFPPGSRCCKP